MTILNVEDEPQLARQISKALQRAGHEVHSAPTGKEGLLAVEKHRLDLIVLDVNLPGELNGLDVLKTLRKRGDTTRIIMLTARGEVTDRVNALKAGADDYLTKPFSMDELLARVEALGRRQSNVASEQIFQVADLKMDLVNRKVQRGAETLNLAPREFEILSFFMKEPGRTFSRDEICERIWQREHEYETRTVEIFIMRLRKKIDENRASTLIETVRGVGYKMNANA